MSGLQGSLIARTPWHALPSYLSLVAVAEGFVKPVSIQLEGKVLLYRPATLAVRKLTDIKTETWRTNGEHLQL